MAPRFSMPNPQVLKLWQNAEHKLQLKQYDLARASYERLVGEPEMAPMARLRLSLIASSEGRYRDAVDEALAAYKVRVADPDLLEMIAKRLLTLGELETAVACATDPVVVGTRNVSTVAELGKMLSDASFPEHSLRLLGRARELGLDSPVLRYLFGLNLMYTGDADAAQRELESCLRDEPGMALALWLLGKLGREPTDGIDRIERLQTSLSANGALPQSDIPLLQYALFSELEQRGDTEPAWQALEAGMSARRRQVRYDSAAEQDLFNHLGTLGPHPGLGHVADGPRPVFILGMPRSGTTLLERVLGGHPDVADAGELTDLVRQLRWCCDLAGGKLLDMPLALKAEQGIDWSMLGERYLAHTQWRAQGSAIYTDKLPANFTNIAYILRALPQARILHMVRDPMDSCFSNLKALFAGAYPHSYDQVEMADHFRRYRMLMAHWHTTFPGRILDVRYAELVEAPERVSREVLDFCGLPWHEGLTAIENRTGTVATASAAQVREPIHQRYVGQWRRYESHLAPLRERLGALAY